MVVSPCWARSLISIPQGEDSVVPGLFPRTFTLKEVRVRQWARSFGLRVRLANPIVTLKCWLSFFLSPLFGFEENARGSFDGLRIFVSFDRFRFSRQG